MNLLDVILQKIMTMKKSYILILSACLLGCITAFAQDAPRIKQPDLQTTEFFDPTKEKEQAPYVFSTDWRIEAGYVQYDERTLDTTAFYQHGLRLGATVDFNLPHNFSVQTGALATVTSGINAQHWRSMDVENVQVEVLNHNILQLQLTIPARVYYMVTLWKELRLFFFAGPQLQIGLTNYERYMEKELYRTNIQFGLGGGLEWDRYRLQAGYDFGLNNIMRTPGIPNQ